MVSAVNDLARTDEPFEIFFNREFSAIAVIAGTIAGSRAAGEDIAQEALSRAASRWGELSGFDRPGAWVRRVAINLAIDGQRRLGRETAAVARLDVRPHTDDHRSGDPMVWAAVDALPPRQRAVVVLHYFEDRPVAEIAELLDITVSGTTSHLHKARTTLASLLDPTNQRSQP